MKIPIYQVDAFASRVFSGNPAAVCILEEWLDDSLLQSIAAENNLSETAFVVSQGQMFDLRWFTPATEVALCGHATLATAFVLFHVYHHPEKTVFFQTSQRGRLAVTRKDDLLELDFPAMNIYEQAAPDGLAEALHIEPQQVFGSADDLLAVFGSEEDIRGIQPDFSRLEQVDCRGVIVTARGNECDFVSRFFGPQVGIPEDPVTGSAHCVLAPYWAQRLGKNSLHALQVSSRGGELFCQNAGDRVRISGRAVMYMQGEIDISGYF
ncbi:MAG: PhzF family phenazine biosynthesis protein [Desulfonatronovibrio sp.]